MYERCSFVFFDANGLNYRWLGRGGQVFLSWRSNSFSILRTSERERLHFLQTPWRSKLWLPLRMCARSFSLITGLRFMLQQRS